MTPRQRCIVVTLAIPVAIWTAWMGHWGGAALIVVGAYVVWNNRDDDVPYERITETDRDELRQRTERAWRLAEDVTRGRVPRFGYRTLNSDD